jgi:hypothetical protein
VLELVGEDIAAFGIVGGTLLVLGFFAQSLTYFGVEVSCSRGVMLAVAAATLLIAALVAWTGYGLILRWLRGPRTEESEVPGRHEGHLHRQACSKTFLALVAQALGVARGSQFWGAAYSNRPVMMYVLASSARSVYV